MKLFLIIAIAVIALLIVYFVFFRPKPKFAIQRKNAFGGKMDYADYLASKGLREATMLPEMLQYGQGKQTLEALSGAKKKNEPITLQRATPRGFQPRIDDYDTPITPVVLVPTEQLATRTQKQPTIFGS